MAKRKAARATGRKRAGKRAGANRSRSRAAGAARKSAARKSAARESMRKVARKTAVRKTPRRRAGKAAARKSLPHVVRSVRSGGKRTATLASVRKAPALNRERRVVSDDDLFPTPPSSLDLDRTALSTRTGRHEMVERLHDHTETSPALTGGDVDADWAGAYATGDEAPGGDNPTPNQDVVDDIGKSLGVQYEDNEELRGEKKISDRDKKRWELDPASSEDYDDR